MKSFIITSDSSETLPLLLLLSIGLVFGLTETTTAKSSLLSSLICLTRFLLVVVAVVLDWGLTISSDESN